MGSGRNWYQIGNNTCYIPKLSDFSVEKEIYIKSLESAIFGRPELNTKEGFHGIEVWRSWNAHFLCFLLMTVKN